MSENESELRRKRPRSPSYPGIDLETAVERATALFNAEGRNAAYFEAILEHWGYSAKSGAGQVTLAALRKYGLLVYEGKAARLSELAFRILWNEPGSEDRRSALSEAALSPSIHRELWDQYNGDLPSDATLRLELRKRGFAESAIPEFITTLRATLAFAQLSGSDRLPDKDVDRSPSAPPSHSQMTQTLQPPRHVSPGAPPPIQLPLLGGTVVTLQASGPVSDEAWEQMMVVLKALKPGFVAPREPTAPPEPSE